MRPAGFQHSIRRSFHKLRAETKGLETTEFAHWIDDTVTLVTDPADFARIGRNLPRITAHLNALHGARAKPVQIEVVAGDAGSRAALEVAHAALDLANHASAVADEANGEY